MAWRSKYLWAYQDRLIGTHDHFRRKCLIYIKFSSLNSKMSHIGSFILVHSLLTIEKNKLRCLVASGISHTKGPIVANTKMHVTSRALKTNTWNLIHTIFLLLGIFWYQTEIFSLVLNLNYLLRIVNTKKTMLNI